MKQNLKSMNVEFCGQTAIELIRDKIYANMDAEDAFFVCDFGDIIHKYNLWTKKLPRVEPFYAVKCNDDIGVLSLLATLGTGFDCASKNEIQKVMALKVEASRIIYANPCKQNSHIKYATKRSVDLLTFDNETELRKVKATNPNAKMVLRILPPTSEKVQCQLGNKFGCLPKNAKKLLIFAKDLGVDVVGVSFHVGSGCYDAKAFSNAVAISRMVFDQAREIGFNFNLLDIGGGFPGQNNAKITFDDICDELVPALDKYFPEESGVRIIAEPGRFFVASAFTIAVNIIAKRVVARDEDHAEQEPTANDEPSFMYYVNDGVYGSFNCLLYDHAEVSPQTLYEMKADVPLYDCSIWGPTCDGLDCITKQGQLPQLDTGDWIIFPDMGAYTISASTTFNGMPRPRIFYMANQIYEHIVGRKKVAELKFIDAAVTIPDTLLVEPVAF